MILVDYLCEDCGSTAEHFVAAPAPASRTCECGGEARRVWAAVGLSGRAAAPTTAAPARSGPLCSRFPQVPGLCHMSESAGRRWLAAYRKDHRALEGEIARQEEAASVRKPEMADAVTPHHH